jgi:hypothetical protein
MNGAPLSSDYSAALAFTATAGAPARRTIPCLGRPGRSGRRYGIESRTPQGTLRHTPSSTQGYTPVYTQGNTHEHTVTTPAAEQRGLGGSP